MSDETPSLPPLSAQPSRAEVAALLRTLKHDWIGMMQAFRVGLELLAHDESVSSEARDILALMRENVERGFAYGQTLERLIRQLESE